MYYSSLEEQNHRMYICIVKEDLLGQLTPLGLDSPTVDIYTLESGDTDTVASQSRELDALAIPL